MEFFRGVPLVMVIFWIWFIIPILLKTKIPEFGVALTAFVIFEAAYLGEIVRAGIQSVPRGQVEAATAVGLSPSATMRHVVLPQALKNMIPSLVTQFIVLFKDTSLASIIGFMDLTKAAQVVNNREIRPFELYLFIALVYWVCTYSMSRYARAPGEEAGPCLRPCCPPASACTGARRAIPRKPPLVWIHGGSVEESSLMLGDLEPFLGRVRALLPDTRGHGLSEKFERAEDYTYARKAEDLGPWLDGLGVAAAVWGGASMGAALSLWTAIHAPARVRGVISISGPPYAPPPEDTRGGRPIGRSSPPGASTSTSTPTSGCAWARTPSPGSRRGRSVTRSSPACCGGTRWPRSSPSSTRPTRGANGSPTAPASAVRCRSSRGRRTASPPSRCRNGWPPPSPRRGSTWWRAGRISPTGAIAPRSRA